MAGDRERCELRQFVGPRERLRQSTDAMDRAHRVQVLAGVGLRAQQHRPGDGATHLAAQPVDGPAVDHQSELGRGDAEHAGGGGHAQVAGDGQLRARAECRSVDRGDGGDTQIGEATQRGHECGDELAALDAGQVGAGAERRWRAGEHQHSGTARDRRTLGICEREQGWMIDSVAAFRPIDRDDDDTIAPLHTYHGATVCRPARQTPSARRQQIAHWTLIANRIGYLCFGFAIVAFVLAFALGFNATMSSLIIGSLIVGSILLAPAIVLGYAVKAAERDDREKGL